MSEMAMFILAMMRDRRNMQRINRRQLRDSSDPFQLADERFLELFQFSKHAAFELLKELNPHLKDGVRKTFIPKSIRLAAALRYYATGSFQNVGQDFYCPLSKPMISRIVHEVSYVISTHLSKKCIQFPTSKEEQNKIRQSFFSATGFPGVIGALGCTQIKIKRPTADADSAYRNPRGFHSKNVQLICDSDLNILACYARFGGGTSDTSIWEKSMVKTFMKELHTKNANSCWLVADSQYPLEPWLMTPFKRPQNELEEKYNEHHTKAQDCVQRLSAVLKKVFTCLSEEKGLQVPPVFSGAIINACCALHNYRKLHNLAMPAVTPENLNQTTDDTTAEDTQELELNSNSVLSEGRKTRDTLVQICFNQ